MLQLNDIFILKSERLRINECLLKSELFYIAITNYDNWEYQGGKCIFLQVLG